LKWGRRQTVPSFFYLSVKMAYNRRSNSLGQVAYKLGLSWVGDDTDGTLPFLRDFQLVRGHSKKIKHLMQERDGLLETDIRIFDYQHTISAGNTHKKENQTVFFVQSQNLGLPELYLRPEHFLHKVGEYLNLTRDIDFEEHPEFSKKYRLTGKDEDFIRASFNEDVLHFFTFNKKWSFEGVGYYFILYRRNKLIPPDEIERFYQMGKHLIRMLKSDFPPINP
jgi:hypothetical protein